MGMQLKLHMVTIEDLVPEGHFLRKLEATLDLSFVREETAYLYSPRYGRPPIAPVMLVKYLLDRDIDVEIPGVDPVRNSFASPTEALKLALTQERVVRVGFGQHLDDGLFGRLVDVGDEIVMLFFRDDDAVEVKRGAIDDGGAAAGGFDRRVEHWVHVSFR